MKGEQRLFQPWQNFSLLRNKKNRRGGQAVKKSLPITGTVVQQGSMGF